MTNDFKPFGPVMTKVRDRNMDPSYEVYLALYQAVSGSEEEKNVYKQFSRGFFDLVVIDECHRGSAREDSAWREILDYFEPAIQLGLTAHPEGDCRGQHPHLLRRTGLHVHPSSRVSRTDSSRPTRSSASTSTKTCRVGGHRRA